MSDIPGGCLAAKKNERKVQIIALLLPWELLIMASLPSFCWRRLTVAFLVVALAVPGSCGMISAAVLEVGASHELKVPSAAARVAHDGDTVEIEPGEYFDCAVWAANRLTIAGKGPGVVITDKTCEGKALFITRGNDITVRNITFTRARVPDGNGAGIRIEGRNLTVEHSRFVNNEDGMLSGNSPQSEIRVSDSEFLQNGKCIGNDCAHGIYIGQVALLRIERSKFFETKDGHHVKSRALRTELVGNDITDGPNGTSSYLVDIPNGGSLVMENNTLEKGPHTANPATAIMLGQEDTSQATVELRFSGNTFTNDSGTRTAFVTNWTEAAPDLENNQFIGEVTPVSSAGYWLHRLRHGLGQARDTARGLIDLAKRGLGRLR